MGNEHPNLAVMENKIENIGNLLHSVVNAMEKQQPIIQDVVLAARLQQESIKSMDKTLEAHVLPKVNELWDNRSQAKGGYFVASLISSVLVGGATIFGVYITIKSLLH